MALTLSVTDAGRAALRNPTGNGTNAVRIATVGVTSTAFVSGQPVAGEIKRIATIAGGATAADTIHVTVSDNGGDVYSVRGFGFYLDDGTLFASYSQANVIVEKSAQATMMMAVDVKFTDIDATQITFGDSNFSNPAATTDTLGVVRLASDAEAIAGADAQKALTAKNLLAALNDRLGAGAPTAFVKTLLTKASVLAFCTALGIRGAAQYDTGAGNGLDADLLDGKDGSYYQQWANLVGVPTTFAPAPHQHSAADITSGTLVVARGGTGLSTATAGSYLIGNGANAFQLKAPADVLTDIGAAAKQHSHPISDIVGLQSALDAKTTPAAVATQISAAVSGLINGAPGALDTLKELADAMGDDPNFAASVTNALAGKVAKAGDTMTGGLSLPTLYVANGSGEADIFMRYGGSPSRQIYFSNNAGGFAINYTDANGNYVGNGIWMNNTNGAVNIGSLSVGGGGFACASLANFAAGLMATGGITATAQGAHIGWNRNTGSINGETDYINHKGGGSGGHAFWNTDGASYALLVEILPQGTLRAIPTASGPSTPNNFGLRTEGAYGGGVYLNDPGGGQSWGLYCSSGNLYFGSGAVNGGALSQRAYINTSGAIVANGGFQYSDRRLKTNIKPRAVQRGLALKIARMFTEWERISDGAHDVGLIAQRVWAIAARYVTRGPRRGRNTGLLSIDKAGIALECSMDNALHLHDHDKQIAALLKRINRLEKAA